MPPAVAAAVCCPCPPSGWQHPFPLLLGLLPADGSLPKGTIWPKVRTLPGDSHISYWCVCGGGRRFEQGWSWRPEHLISRGDNSEGPPSSRASSGIVWGLWGNCAVEQLFQLSGPILHFCTDDDSQGIPNRLPVQESPRQGQLPGNLVLRAHLWYLLYFDCLLPFLYLSAEVLTFLKARRWPLTSLCPRGPKTGPCT